MLNVSKSFQQKYQSMKFYTPTEIQEILHKLRQHEKSFFNAPLQDTCVNKRRQVNIKLQNFLQAA